jgi:hypothetical protein
MSNFLFLGAIFLAGALIYRHRHAILVRLRRFDERNAARREEEWQALFDSNAHYRHTVRLMEEQFEPVQEFPYSDPRTGPGAMRYVFQGVDYGSREEAEAARRGAIIEKARTFYMEMDTIMLRRGSQHERTPDALGLPEPKQEGQ